MRGTPSLLLAWLAASLLFASTALAGYARDGAAEKKIQEAMYTHFLNMDFDTAEGLLVGTHRACEDKCSPQVKARLWMYVGIVRGSGRQDISGAEEAFRQALTEDSGVALDGEIATPDVKEAFARVAEEMGGSGGTAAPAATAGGGGGMRCTLDVSEVEVRRPIPIECESDEELENAKIFYSNFKVDWTSVTMKAEDGLWRGTIPCSVTSNTGTLKWYVVGYDDERDEADSVGSKGDPRKLEIVGKSSEEPPAFPDEDPPGKCDITDIAPATMGECAGWGGSCGGDGCCETGLVCLDGVCEQEQCERNSDCPGGECIDGKCSSDGEEGGGDEFAKNYIGLHFGLDVASISTDGACTDDSRANESFTCTFGDGSDYRSAPNNNFGGQIGGGFTPSTMRILASFNRLFGPVDLGIRAGFAFNGGPNLMPAHIGAQVGYWFVGDFAKDGPRVGAHVGGGLAQVDATVDVDVKDCARRDGQGNVILIDGTDEPDVDGACIEAPDAGVVTTLQATKQLGLTYVGLGLDLMYAVAPNTGPVLNVNFLFMVPSTGMVLQPTLGWAYGF